MNLNLVTLIELQPQSPLKPIIAELAQRDKLPRLVPESVYSEEIRQQLLAAHPDTALGSALTDVDMARAVLSGLLLWNDCLDDSHTLAQQIETPDGSYWHGIMHRREPDYANSKYWFRRVGQHPLFLELARAAATRLARSRARLAGDLRQRLDARGKWDPSYFVDLCEAAAEGNDAAAERLLAEIQEIEIRSLLNHCIRKALGS